MGINYGPQIQVYYLIAGWCFVCMIAMFALTQTPLGRMANAVRDNPERARFVGYNPTRVRCLMLTLAGFFAGIGGRRWPRSTTRSSPPKRSARWPPATCC